jgi:hypothetical protein
MNPHLAEELNLTNIYPEYDAELNKSVLMSALQGLILSM